MTHTVKDDECTLCGGCQTLCPQQAIKPNRNGDGYWIDPTLCNDCEGEEVPLCQDFCEDHAVTTLKPKKRRGILISNFKRRRAACLSSWNTSFMLYTALRI